MAMPFARFGLFLLILLTGGCGLFSEDKPEERYVEFTHRDEKIDYTFVAKTSDPDVIGKVEDQLALPFGERHMHIHGDIARGDGGFNENWNWHFVPDRWDLVEISVEVCDGRPRMVEEDPDYWIDQVGYFCPWSSRVAGEVERN